MIKNVVVYLLNGYNPQVSVAILFMKHTATFWSYGLVSHAPSANTCCLYCCSEKRYSGKRQVTGYYTQPVHKHSKTCF